MLVGMCIEVPRFLRRQVGLGIKRKEKTNRLTLSERNAAGKRLEFPPTMFFRACSSIGLGRFPGFIQLFRDVSHRGQVAY